MRLSRTPHLRVASAMWSCIFDVDGLPLRQRLVEGQLAEHGPQRGAGHLVDGQTEVVDLEQGQLDVGHLAEDGGADPQGHVVLGDHRLLIAGAGELADVDLVHPVGQRHQHVETRAGRWS